MEQHPVPQNIIGFQFKLIGDMTVRQFAYLAAGIIAGYLTLQLGWPTIIKAPLAFLIGGGGFAFAFLPLEERPLDRWLISFFQRVYSPTQFLWKKKGVPPEILTSPVPVSTQPLPETLKKEATQAKVDEYLKTLPADKEEKVDQQQNTLLDQISALFTPAPATQVPLSEPVIRETAKISSAPPPPPPPTNQNVPFVAKKPTIDWKTNQPPIEPTNKPVPQPVKPPEDLTYRTQNLTNQISSLQHELANQQITKERFLEIQAQLTKLLGEKERLTAELISLRKQLAEVPETVVRPAGLAEAPKESMVKIVSPSVAPQVGMPKLPEIANAPSGIIKSPKGQVLPGVIVEIKNQEGTPVRALKSGKLGQFSVSTPLANGTYTIHLEDPQKNFYFDIIEVPLTGKIIAPLEIFAKTEKDKIREELTKKLFSQDKF